MRENGTPSDRGRDAPTCRLGRYLARDGSDGDPVHLDLSRAHAACVFGKRGSGKSYTLGVLAEALCRARGVVPVVVDPMGAFGGLCEAGATVREPRIGARALAPRDWPELVGLDPVGEPGSLVWRAAEACDSLAGMRDAVRAADATDGAVRAADNALGLAASWGVFDPDGLAAPAEPTVLSLSGLPQAPSAAVVRAVASALYDAHVDSSADGGDDGPLPWVLLDEAHAFVDGVAWPAIERILTRGRAPGVSLVLATQRPGVLPGVARSQADLLVAHRLSGRADREVLADARPSFVTGPLVDRLPTATGEALVFDDATERAHAVRVRERRTTHGGSEPRVAGR